jgi:ubiquinone/menaquinone biosynthesis C-methylase UbiE
MRRSEYIAEQASNPRGLLGWIIAMIMSKETALDNKKAIELLQISKGDVVVDLGTGHGQSLKFILRLANPSKVIGVDYSGTMLAIAKQKNRDHIIQGWVELIKAKTDCLPFKDASIDRALTVHTLYFWENAGDHFNEIARVLRPNGVFVLAYRPANDAQVVAKFPASIYHFRSINEVSKIARRAGFRELETIYTKEPGKSIVWLLLQKCA